MLLILGIQYLVSKTKPNCYKTGIQLSKTKLYYMDTKPEPLGFGQVRYCRYPTQWAPLLRYGNRLLLCSRSCEGVSFLAYEIAWKYGTSLLRKLERGEGFHL